MKIASLVLARLVLSRLVANVANLSTTGNLPTSPIQFSLMMKFVYLFCTVFGNENCVLLALLRLLCTTSATTRETSTSAIEADEIEQTHQFNKN